MNVLLAVIGVVATVVIGCATLYLAVRIRYPGRLTFIRESYIGLFDSIVRNLPDLSVLYKDEPVSQNLVLMKGVLVNTAGSRDIGGDMVEEPVAIELPSDYKWLAANVVNASDGVRAETKVLDNSRLTFDIGLLRRKEYVRFDALAEVPEIDEPESSETESPALILERAARFRHRIRDTADVEKISSDWPSKSLNRAGEAFFVSASVAVIGIAFWLVSVPFEGLYLVKTSEESTIMVRRTDLGETKYKVEGIDTQYLREASAREFSNELNGQILSGPVYTMTTPEQDVVHVTTTELGEDRYLLEGLDSDYQIEVTYEELYSDLQPVVLASPHLITTSNGNEVIVTVTFSDVDRLLLEGVNSDFTQELSVREFYARDDVKPMDGDIFGITTSEGNLIPVKRTLLEEKRLRIKGVNSDFSQELTASEFYTRDDVKLVDEAVFTIETAEGVVIPVKRSLLEEQRIRLEGVGTDYVKEVDSYEFYGELDAEYQSVRRTDWMAWLIYGLFGGVFALSLSFAAVNLVSWRRFKVIFQSVAVT